MKCCGHKWLAVCQPKRLTSSARLHGAAQILPRARVHSCEPRQVNTFELGYCSSCEPDKHYPHCTAEPVRERLCVPEPAGHVEWTRQRVLEPADLHYPPGALSLSAQLHCLPTSSGLSANHAPQVPMVIVLPTCPGGLVSTYSLAMYLIVAHEQHLVVSAPQVLVSMQGLVLVAEPYYNEAGYERQVGRAACLSG